MARKPHWPKLVRTTFNQVTDQLEQTPLTPVQLAFERCTRFVENEMKVLGLGPGMALAEKLEEWLCRMQPHTE